MIGRFAVISALAILFGFPGGGQSAFAQSQTSLSTEALSAKSILEDLLIKRFSQDLSTKIQKDLYSIGATLDLVPKAEDKSKNSYEVIDDLALGALDPESLMKKLSGPGANEMAANLLNQYSISKVQVSVGLSPDLGEDKKTEVQAWLDARLKSEYGTKAKGEVTFINKLLEQTPERSFLDHLKNFQDLAGQVVLALALLIGALLWGLLASKNASQGAGNQSISVNSGGGEAGKGGLPQESSLSIEKKQKEEERLVKEVAEIREKLLALLPKVSGEFENILRSWCDQGESGRVRLICFAEAVGQQIGKLPIPVDAMPDVTKVFAQMPNMQLKEKRDALDKAYWDILAVLNLGTETLNQPFSYIGGLNVGSLNEVLIEQNPKMRTLVALYMPEDLRNQYLGSLDEATKVQILQSATDFNEIALSELKEVDGNLAAKVKGKGKGGEGIVPLEMTLQKVVGALNALEKVNLLKDLQGSGVEQFKRTTASLAFLHQWPDDALAKLVSRANVDELLAFVRTRTDLQERMIAAAPPMTAAMAKDELARMDSTTVNDKVRLLNNLESKVQDLINEKELDLETIFSQTKASDQASDSGSKAA